MIAKFCNCCHEQIIGEVVEANPWNDETVAEFCSWECVEHTEDQHQEYLDSYGD